MAKIKPTRAGKTQYVQTILAAGTSEDGKACTDEFIKMITTLNYSDPVILGSLIKVLTVCFAKQLGDRRGRIASYALLDAAWKLVMSMNREKSGDPLFYGYTPKRAIEERTEA